MTRMPWGEFLVWNALGGITWATSVALVAYFVGDSAEALFRDVGIIGVAVAVIVIAGLIYWRRRSKTTPVEPEVEARH